VEAVLDRLSSLCNLDTSKDYKPAELVRMGMVDPVKVFVKQEPHKLTKIQEGRVRLICSVSLLDNLIARLLCSQQNNTEILRHSTLPVKPGLGLHNDGLKALNSYVNTVFSDHDPAEGDVKGWDWSFQEWDFTMDCERRIHLARASGTVFEKILKSHFYCMARKVFVLSDGTMHEQIIPGIMPSGWYNTSSSNSNCRCMNHHMIAIEKGFDPRIMAMGDDSVEVYFDDAIDAYSRLGKNMSMFNKVSRVDFEFCSTRFNGYLGVPVNIDKQIYNLLSNQNCTQTAALELWLVFKYEMRNLPWDLWIEIRKVIAHSGWLDHYSIPILQSGCIQIGSQRVIAQNSFCAKQNAKRLHGVPINGIFEMYSPGPSFWYPIQMTKTKTKKASKIKQLEQKMASMQLAKQKQKKKTPFADTGGIIGRAAGSFFGNSKVGSSVGRWLGSGIGSIFGSGDYQVVGANPKYNILNGNVPQFSSTRATNIVCHREYIGDVVGTTAFTNTLYPLNPGVSNAFPWLQGIASNYQQYRFHGMVFEFRPLITDFVTSGAPGVMIMATNYNSDLPRYTTKQEMENSEFAVSVKPTMALRHMVECDPRQTPISELYVRAAPVPSGQDLRVYDLGTFQLATQGNPNQLLGELWVTYCVEFFKPTLDLSNQTTGSASAHIVRSAVSTANPLGTIGVSVVGGLSVVITSTSLQVTNAIVGVVYNVNTVFSCTTAATNNVALPSTYTGCTSLGYNSNLGTADNAGFTNTTGVSATVSATNQFVIATSTSFTLTYSGTGTYGAGPNGLEILISAVDLLVTN